MTENDTPDPVNAFIAKATEAIEALQSKVANLEEFKTKATEAVETLQRQNS